MRRLWALIGFTICLCWTGAANEVRPLVLGTTTIELTAGRSAPLLLGRGAPSIDREGMSITAETEPAGPYSIAAGLQPAEGGIFLAAPPTMPAGTYTVRIQLSDRQGNRFIASVPVLLTAPEPVAQEGRPPVVLINGFDIGSVLQGGGCTLAPDSTGTFGQLEALVTTDGAAVKFFDNCVYGTPRIEVLGEELGKFIAALKHTDGSPVEEVDIVGFSMGALVARSYLAGKKVAAGTFDPPTDPKVRKLILVAAENFGAPLANLTNAGEQIPQLKPASLFSWELNTWHQGYDDLREVDALAIAGTGGGQGSSDGVAPLAGASLSGSVFNRPLERTRILPACHNAAAASQCSTAAVLMNVDSANHPSARIIRSFLGGTEDWRQIGETPATNTVLSTQGTAYFALKDSTDAFVTNITSVVASPPSGPRPDVTLTKGPANIYRAQLAAGGEYDFEVSRPGANAVFEGEIPAGGGVAIQAKLGPSIARILPSAGLVDTLSVAPDSLISIYGDDLADSQASATTLPLPTTLGGATVTANGAPLGLLFAGPGQINAFVPSTLSGLVRIKVTNSKGHHTVNVLIAAAVPAAFAQDGSGTGPAAALHALTGQLITGASRTAVGGFVSLYVTGLGITKDLNGVQEAVIRPEVSVGGVAARVLYAGSAGGFLGLNQINIEILAGTPAGPAVPVTIRSGTHVSNEVTLAIQ